LILVKKSTSSEEAVFYETFVPSHKKCVGNSNANCFFYVKNVLKNEKMSNGNVKMTFLR